VGLITGEVGAGKSTAARVFTATLNTSLYKILYAHFSSGSALDLLRQIALELDLAPASPSPCRGVFWSASSNCPRRSLWGDWRRCAAPWEQPATRTYWWIRGPAAIC
jgi:hypothetical protein